MKTYLVVLFLGLSAGLWGQKDTDVITLKSGAVYKGVISEYLPLESVTIKLVDGRVMTFKAEEIKRIADAGKNIIEIKPTGFFNRSTFGLTYWNEDSYTTGESMFSTVLGYKHHKSTFGFATGIEPIKRDVFVPLLLDYSYSFSESRLSTFFALECGYVFNPAFAPPTTSNDIGFETYKNGFTGGLQLGIRNYNNQNFGLIFSIGYRYYNLSAGEYPDADLLALYFQIPQETEIHRFSVRLGILLN